MGSSQQLFGFISSIMAPLELSQSWPHHGNRNFEKILLEEAEQIELIAKALEYRNMLENLDNNGNTVDSQYFKQNSGSGCLTPGHGSVAECDSYCHGTAANDLIILSEDNQTDQALTLVRMTRKK